MGKAKRLRKERKKRKEARAAADSFTYRLARNLGITPQELKENSRQAAELMKGCNTLDDLVSRIVDKVNEEGKG